MVGQIDWDEKYKIDIVAQTLAQLVIDIAAASIGNVPVDLNAQSIGNLDIDVVAQTIGNLDIDVKAQTLAQLINRPKYGGAELGSYSNAIAGLTTETLIDITGVGMIYGGWIRCTDTTTHKADIPRIWIDDMTIEADTWNSLNQAGVWRNPISPMSLTRYDETNFEYALMIGYGFTFETSVKLKYSNVYGDGTAVAARLYYATI
jgi:hypothetical protein